MLLLVAHVVGEPLTTFEVGFLDDHVGGHRPALRITSATLLIVAAIIADNGRRSVRPDTQAMEEEWAGRPAEPAIATGEA